MVLGALLCASSVLIGAFGAHLLKTILIENGRTDTFNTAMNYLIFHSLAVLIAGITLKNAKVIAGLFVLGILFFSGSLIALSLTNLTFFGALAPMCGLSFMIGWLRLTYAISKTAY